MVGQKMFESTYFEKGGIYMSKIKTILGAVSAVGLSLGGLIMAGKSGFGKSLGERPEEDINDDGLFCEDCGEVTEETTPDNEEEETE